MCFWQSLVILVLLTLSDGQSQQCPADRVVPGVVCGQSPGTRACPAGSTCVENPMLLRGYCCKVKDESKKLVPIAPPVMSVSMSAPCTSPLMHDGFLLTCTPGQADRTCPRPCFSCVPLLGTFVGLCCENRSNTGCGNPYSAKARPSSSLSTPYGSQPPPPIPPPYPPNTRPDDEASTSMVNMANIISNSGNIQGYSTDTTNSSTDVIRHKAINLGTNVFPKPQKKKMRPASIPEIPRPMPIEQLMVRSKFQKEMRTENSNMNHLQTEMRATRKLTPPRNNFPAMTLDDGYMDTPVEDLRQTALTTPSYQGPRVQHNDAMSEESSYMQRQNQKLSMNQASVNRLTPQRIKATPIIARPASADQPRARKITVLGDKTFSMQMQQMGADNVYEQTSRVETLSRGSTHRMRGRIAVERRRNEYIDRQAPSLPEIETPAIPRGAVGRQNNIREHYVEQSSNMIPRRRVNTRQRDVVPQREQPVATRENVNSDTPENVESTRRKISIQVSQYPTPEMQAIEKDNSNVENAYVDDAYRDIPIDVVPEANVITVLGDRRLVSRKKATTNLDNSYAQPPIQVAPGSNSVNFPKDSISKHKQDMNIRAEGVDNNQPVMVNTNIIADIPEHVLPESQEIVPKRKIAAIRALRPVKVLRSSQETIVPTEEFSYPVQSNIPVENSDVQFPENVLPKSNEIPTSKQVTAQKKQIMNVQKGYMQATLPVNGLKMKEQPVAQSRGVSSKGMLQIQKTDMETTGQYVKDMNRLTTESSRLNTVTSMPVLMAQPVMSSNRIDKQSRKNVKHQTIANNNNGAVPTKKGNDLAKQSVIKLVKQKGDDTKVIIPEGDIAIIKDSINNTVTTDMQTRIDTERRRPFEGKPILHIQVLTDTARLAEGNAGVMDLSKTSGQQTAYIASPPINLSGPQAAYIASPTINMPASQGYEQERNTSTQNVPTDTPPYQPDSAAVQTPVSPVVASVMPTPPVGNAQPASVQNSDTNSDTSLSRSPLRDNNVIFNGPLTVDNIEYSINLLQRLGIDTISPGYIQEVVNRMVPNNVDGPNSNNAQNDQNSGPAGQDDGSSGLQAVSEADPCGGPPPVALCMGPANTQCGAGYRCVQVGSYTGVCCPNVQNSSPASPMPARRPAANPCGTSPPVSRCLGPMNLRCAAGSHCIRVDSVSGVCCLDRQLIGGEAGAPGGIRPVAGTSTNPCGGVPPQSRCMGPYNVQCGPGSSCVQVDGQFGVCCPVSGGAGFRPPGSGFLPPSSSGMRVPRFMPGMFRGG